MPGEAVQFLLDPKDARTMWCKRDVRSSAAGAPAMAARASPSSATRPTSTASASTSADPARKTILIGLHERDRSLHLSSDGGASFHLIGDHLPEGSGFSTLPIVLDGSTFLTNTSGWGDKKWGIWRSQDGGATWAKVSDAGPARLCAHLAQRGDLLPAALGDGPYRQPRPRRDLAEAQGAGARPHHRAARWHAYRPGRGWPGQAVRLER